ncbi:helix-hairpin-helix domain-containing protein [Aestuariibacter halophilus]|uniref:Helix-hairpin-helix domain-containing protein n=1 Tax=Fluctibacter halophilus TaxID=226011 RepID=A0ABS8G583_9ALTE|nr:helix-hairpin-helix domain-containing protein [Aestuariibacter halophilus]MCC2614829.1 helix-hairpin-helix domain-containing protein [Aestuariibacter halophilus]
MKKYLPTLIIACGVHLASFPPVQAQTLEEKVAVAQTRTAKVNINTATLIELQRLPGIGASKAKAILDYRESHGPFSSVAALTSVKGIGERMVAKLADHAEAS